MLVPEQIRTEFNRPGEQFWENLELDVQRNYAFKDPDFRLTGPWKREYGTYRYFRVYLVDGDWVRRNLSVIFGHGGHGYVHEFIPADELWIADEHYTGCECVGVAADWKCSSNFIQSCLLHEATEHDLMKQGVPYHLAHQAANEAERKAGWLKDTWIENYGEPFKAT